MKILYVTSEASPFCKTGGLADVAGSLPPALAAGGDDVAVILPLYGQISDEWKAKMTFRNYIYVDLAWRHEYCGLFSLEYKGVTWYFVDNERYFRRGQLYGEFDDGERFAFFSRAVVSLLPSLDWMPDVVHCNDWQSALVPIYIKDESVRWDGLRNVRTMITIHNIEYQGQYDFSILGDVFELDWRSKNIVEYDGCINLMKGAIASADIVTTVSPRYADEICSPEYAHGLDRILRDSRFKLLGILNGIDYNYYAPEKDSVLAVNYGVGELSKKYENKLALQRELGLPERDEVPVISIITRLVSHSFEGQKISDIYPNFKGVLDIECTGLDIDDIYLIIIV